MRSIRTKQIQMSERPYTCITGTGMYIPKRRVSNAELLTILGLPDSNWIEDRTGIRERRWCTDGEDLFSMSIEAADSALKDARVKDIDTIIVARSRFTDPRCFVNAGAIHGGLRSRGYNLDCVDYADGFYACSGSLTALNEAQLRIASGQSQRSLVVASAVGSKFISKSSPYTSCLWGDGAAAWIVEASEKPGIMFYCGRGLSEGWDAFPLGVDEENQPYAALDGEKIIRAVINDVPRFVHDCLERAGHSLEEIAQVIFHQGNKLMSDKLCKKLGIAPEKAPSNVEIYGNCSCASIPMVYHEARRDLKLRNGDLYLMVGFGAAFHMNLILCRL